MGRPPTPVGHYGTIKTQEVTFAKRDGTKSKRFEARALFRMGDGSTKDVTRTGSSKTNAENRLKEHLSELVDEIRGGEITPDTRMAKIAAMWLDELGREAEQGTLAAGTARNYRSHWTHWIAPRIGELQAREVRAMTVDRLIRNAKDNRSYATAKGVRAAVMSLCAFAIRYGAMNINPARSASRMVNTGSKEVRAMTLEERLDFAGKLEVFAGGRQVDKKGRSLGRRGVVWLAMPDLYEAMLSTGVRVGELLAITGDDVDTANQTVTIGHHIVRITGKGLVRQQLRKGRKSGIVLRVPSWSMPMWRRRKLASGGGPVFPGWRGGWLDPSNTIHRVREAFNECGYEWVTSHVFRKTVATIMDEAGLPTSAIADQLGNTQAVVDKHYRAKRAVNEAGAEALEGVFGGSRGVG